VTTELQAIVDEIKSGLVRTLAETMAMLDNCAVNGGRLDIMCQLCGGDDGGLGGSHVVTHAPDCAYMALKTRVESSV